jgi:hypothetical protein
MTLLCFMVIAGVLTFIPIPRSSLHNHTKLSFEIKLAYEMHMVLHAQDAHGCTSSTVNLGNNWTCNQYSAVYDTGLASYSLPFAVNATSGSLIVVGCDVLGTTTSYEAFPYAVSDTRTNTYVSVAGAGNYKTVWGTGTSEGAANEWYVLSNKSSGANTITLGVQSGHTPNNGDCVGFEFINSSGSASAIDINTSNAGTGAAGTCPCKFTAITGTTGAAGELAILMGDEMQSWDAYFGSPTLTEIDVAPNGVFGAASVTSSNTGLSYQSSSMSASDTYYQILTTFEGPATSTAGAPAQVY